MTLSPRPISRSAIPRALEKAERYRLLNEPAQAESICRDVLAVEPDHQGALTVLVLALADELDVRAGEGVREADAVVGQLREPYARAYYGGIVRERWARALVKSGDVGGQALGWLHDAMRLYEEAQSLTHEQDNDEAILRFNACVRLIAQAKLSPTPERFGAIDDGDAPLRR
jgi:hypothetical protein